MRAPSLVAAVLSVPLALGLAACSEDEASPAATPSSDSSASSASASPSSSEPSGPSESSEPAGSPSTTDIAEIVAGLPTCDDVWVAGQVLPTDYAGCKLPGGGFDLGAVLECVDGTPGLSAHGERLWAVLGDEIEDSGAGGLEQDPEYAAAVVSCQG